MSWEDEIREVRRREQIAYQMGGAERVARQHANGRYTVRERVALLLDAGTFHEYGAITGKAEYDQAGELKSFTPSNFVSGTGELDGRRVVLAADDFTVRGGAADARVGNKMEFTEKLALDLKLPIVRLVDGTGGGGSVKTLETAGYTYVPILRGFETSMKLLGAVPVVGACMGSVAGLGAIRVAASHFSVMVKGTSQLFVAGPPVVERGLGRKVSKEELGGSELHAHGSGVVDNEVATEEEAFEQIKRFLSYLPPNVYELPPRVEPTDRPDRREEELISIIPKDRRKLYDVRRVLNLVLDRDSLFEIGGEFGKPLVTGLARVDGYAVGVMANDPKHLGGAVDARASEKMMRFVDLCDTFHLPVVYFVDNPGFLIGPQAEAEGTARFGTRALIAVHQATNPWLSVLIRRCYGVAGAGHVNVDRHTIRYAWPSCDWGSLPIEGGVMAAYRRDIEAAPDPAAREKEIETMLNLVRNPIRTAEAFGIEEIIDPRDTRPLVVDWVRLQYRNLPAQLGPKSRSTRA